MYHHDLDLISRGTLPRGLTSLSTAIRYRRPTLQPLRLLSKAIWYAKQNREFLNCEIVDLEKERGFKSTFFIYAAAKHGFYIGLLCDINRDPLKSVILKMALDGQDFGLHSSAASVYDSNFLAVEKKLASVL